MYELNNPPVIEGTKILNLYCPICKKKTDHQLCEYFSGINIRIIFETIPFIGKNKYYYVCPDCNNASLEISEENIRYCVGSGVTDLETILYYTSKKSSHFTKEDIDVFLLKIKNILEDLRSLDFSSNCSSDNYCYTNEISYSELLLLKIQNLFFKLKELDYPDNFKTERDKIITIFEKLLRIKKYTIDAMKNKNYTLFDNNNRNLYIHKKRLFEYYDSII